MGILYHSDVIVKTHGIAVALQESEIRAIGLKQLFPGQSTRPETRAAKEVSDLATLNSSTPNSSFRFLFHYPNINLVLGCMQVFQA